MGSNGFLWVLLGSSGVLLSFIGFYWICLLLLGFSVFLWVLLGSSRVLLGFTGFYWVLPDFFQIRNGTFLRNWATLASFVLFFLRGLPVVAPAEAASVEVAAAAEASPCAAAVRKPSGAETDVAGCTSASVSSEKLLRCSTPAPKSVPQCQPLNFHNHWDCFCLFVCWLVFLSSLPGVKSFFSKLRPLM